MPQMLLLCMALNKTIICEFSLGLFATGQMSHELSICRVGSRLRAFGVVLRLSGCQFPIRAVTNSFVDHATRRKSLTPAFRRTSSTLFLAASQLKFCDVFEFCSLIFFIVAITYRMHSNRTLLRIFHVSFEAFHSSLVTMLR